MNRFARAATLLLGLGLGVAPQANGDWTTAQRIPGFTGSFAIYSPKVAVARDGSMAVGFSQNGGSVWLSARARGGTWTTLHLNPGSTGDDPSPVMNGRGDLAVVWTGENSIFVRYRPAGDAWESTAVLEAGNSGISTAARIAMNDAGDVLVGWLAYDELAMEYQVHTAFRAKTGPWPATGSFEVAGRPTDVFGIPDIALDDDGNGVAVWSTTYAWVEDEPSLGAAVLRGATRPPGGPWSAGVDLSPRGPEGAIPCGPGFPSLPTTYPTPQLAVDPATGDLALGTPFDPSGVILDGQDCRRSQEDTGILFATGTTLSLPAGGTLYGEWLDSGPVLALQSGVVSVAWREVCLEFRGGSCASRFRSAVAPLGSTLGFSLDSPRPIPAFDVAVAGGRALVVASDWTAPSPNPHPAVAWELLPGVVAGEPATLLANSGPIGAPVAVASNSTGHAAAAITAPDRRVYVAELLLFGDGFEAGTTASWTSAFP